MFQILPNWHPVFVHFSVALLSIAAALQFVSHFVSNQELRNQWLTVARWNLWFGVGLTFLTVAAGVYAYNTVDHDTPSHAAMTEHRNWALVTVALFLLVAGWEYVRQRRVLGPNWLFTGVLLVAAMLLLSTAWHGGELVYRYGLGVKSLPKVEGEGHAHTHSDGHSHADETPSAAHDHADADDDHHDDSADHHHDAPAAGDPEQAPHTHAPGTPPHQD